MTAASTAWVVTQGEYSDYRICAVCPTQADAEALAARANETEESEYYEYRVESVFLADADLEKVTTFYRSVTVWDDGRTTETNPREVTDWPWAWNITTHKVHWRWVRAPTHNGRGGRLDVCGTSARLVAKVFSDRRARLLADPVFRAQGEATGGRK